MKRLKLKNPYSDNVWVIWDCTREQYEAFLKRRHGKDAPEQGGFYRGCVDEIERKDKSSCFYLWFESGREEVLTIIHETNHLVFRLLMYAGVKLNLKTEEAFAYLQEDLCKQILRRK